MDDRRFDTSAATSLSACGTVRRSLPRRGAAAAVVAAVLLSAPFAATGAAATNDLRAHADWILRAQLPDGAIANHVDRRWISPYLGNFAALGLAHAGHVTGEGRYVDSAWRWLDWYQAHQDPSGFVTDYSIVDGAAVGTGDMDSTDAYAGTFLLAVNAAWQATGDIVRLHELEPGVVAAVDAITATQASDGMTWAKPGLRVKYLMDQAETYAGLRAAAVLAQAVGDLALEHRSTAAAWRVRRGVSRLWNESLNAYDWAVHGDNLRQHTDWRLLYPDAVQQAWAVAFGLVGPQRSRELMRRFARNQPDWDRPRAVVRFRSGQESAGFWAPVGWAFARVGDLRRSRAAARRLRAAALSRRRAWPYTPADAGQLVVLEALGDGALARLLGPGPS